MSHPPQSHGPLSSSVESLSEFHLGWLILACIVGLLVAPVVFAIMGEVSSELNKKRWVRTGLASFIVGSMTLVVSLLEGSEYPHVHALVALAFGAGSYWIGPQLRRVVRGWRSKGDA